jgi:surface protein
MNTFKKNNSLLIGSIKEEFPHDPNNLVLVYDTSKEPDNLQVSVPIQGSSPNVVIDWGDGSNEAHTTTGFKTHTYAIPGIYVVQISGTMRALNYGTASSASNNKLKLVRCLSFGNLGLTSLANAFHSCSNFIHCPEILPVGVTTTNTMFFECSQFNDPNISQWNTGNVTNMSFMFYKALLFNQPIGSWNTSKVTNMNSIFLQAVSFNQPIGSWNTQNVINMTRMFDQATSFNQPIGDWNTAKVTAMSFMFTVATSFNQPIGDWDVSKVTTMGFMFYKATSFNQPIGSWNTSLVQNLSYMFNSADSFSQDISSWDIRNVTAMTFMFTLSNWGTSNYDAALIAWSQLISPQSNVSWAVGANKYSSAAASARNVLVSTYNWSISDGGLL